MKTLSKPYKLGEKLTFLNGVKATVWATIHEAGHKNPPTKLLARYIYPLQGSINILPVGSAVIPGTQVLESDLIIN